MAGDRRERGPARPARRVVPVKDPGRAASGRPESRLTPVPGTTPLDSELAALAQRRDALRQAASIRGAKLRPALDAALAELDAAIEALAAARDGDADSAGRGSLAGAEHAERQLLRAVFSDAPVPLFLLERDGTVRRVNQAAGELLDTGTGYATGKPFTAFVNLPDRAAVDTQLAAAMRTGTARHVQCELLTSGGTKLCELTAGPARLRGDSDKLIVAVSPAGAAARHDDKKGATAKAAKDGPLAPVIAAMTRRLDLMTAVSRLLLENATQNEALTLQRSARLLAGEIADWVIVDVARGGRLRRQFAMGPDDQRSAEMTAEVASLDPRPGSLPHAVCQSGNSQLIAHVEDASILGEGPGGVPLLMLLGATSVLSVPLTDGMRSYGSLTLVRQASGGHFEMADLGLVEELGEHLALAIKVDRMARRRTEVTEALRATLLPAELPSVPGVEIATAHLAADSPEVGGDFYDAYRSRTGWGVALGDVCGRGEGVAAVGAAARHAIRVTAYSVPAPAEVLRRVNDLLLAEEFGGKFVTAAAAHLLWDGPSLRVTVACAGHPGPLLARADGPARPIRGGGLPLGIFQEAELGTEEQDLSTGDVLVFFTDGLADARNPELGYFGDRLAGEVTALAGKPPRQIVARLQEVALDFCNGELRDDVTIMALRVGEPPANPG